MPDIGVPELLIVLVIILLLFGPGRIAKMGGELGKGIREFRQGLQSDQSAKALTEKHPEKEPESTPAEKPEAKSETDAPAGSI